MYLAHVFLNPHKYEKLHKNIFSKMGRSGKSAVCKNVMLKMTIDI